MKRGYEKGKIYRFIKDVNEVWQDTVFMYLGETTNRHRLLILDNPYGNFKVGSIQEPILWGTMEECCEEVENPFKTKRKAGSYPVGTAITFGEAVFMKTAEDDWKHFINARYYGSMGNEYFDKNHLGLVDSFKEITPDGKERTHS